MNRKQLIGAIRYAGYHDDYRTGVRPLVEQRVSKVAYDKAFAEGRAAKRRGIGCNCTECAASRVVGG